MKNCPRSRKINEISRQIIEDSGVIYPNVKIRITEITPDWAAITELNSKKRERNNKEISSTPLFVFSRKNVRQI